MCRLTVTPYEALVPSRRAEPRAKTSKNPDRTSRQTQAGIGHGAPAHRGATIDNPFILVFLWSFARVDSACMSYHMHAQSGWTSGSHLLSLPKLFVRSWHQCQAHACGMHDSHASHNTVCVPPGHQCVMIRMNQLVPNCSERSSVPGARDSGVSEVDWARFSLVRDGLEDLLCTYVTFKDTCMYVCSK